MKELVALLEETSYASVAEHSHDPGDASVLLEQDHHDTLAWLAKQHIDGRPGNLPAVTGASAATILGQVRHPNTD